MLNHNESNTESSGCITALLDLLNGMLSPCLPDTAVDVMPTCQPGLPVLLRCMAEPAAQTASAQELLKLVLDRFVAVPDMDITSDDDRLWIALQHLFTATGEAVMTVACVEPFACVCVSPQHSNAMRLLHWSRQG